MWAIEFETHVKNGVIEVPKEYRPMADGQLRIIILKEEKVPKQSDGNRKSNIKNLLKQIKRKNIFQEIDNPSEWQRALRNEWT